MTISIHPETEHLVAPFQKKQNAERWLLLLQHCITWTLHCVYYYSASP